MTTATKFETDSEESPGLETMRAEIAELKRSLTKLVRNLKDEASDDVTDVRNAVEHFGDDASRVYKNMAKQGRRSIRTVGRYVEDEPVMSLLLAFAVGFLGTRILSR